MEMGTVDGEGIGERDCYLPFRDAEHEDHNGGNHLILPLRNESGEQMRMTGGDCLIAVVESDGISFFKRRI